MLCCLPYLCEMLFGGVAISDVIETVLCDAGNHACVANQRMRRIVPVYVRWRPVMGVGGPFPL
jgi:hypothetical protein